MTLDQKIESLLPRYKESQDQSGVPGHIVLTNGGYNKAIQQCATNLKQAFERGEIVFVEPKQFSGYSTETPNKDIGMLKLNRTKDSGCKHESNAIQGFGDSSTETPKGDV